jgi:hypothetical protein
MLIPAQRINARSDQFLGERQGRRKTHDFCSERFDRIKRTSGWQSPREHNVRHFVGSAHRDQFEQLRMHGD